jgi:DNA-binding beta-propeller fold protein YncE
MLPVGRRRSAALLPVAALMVALSSPLLAQDLLYVVSQDDATVAVIDMGTNQLVETVDLKRLGYSGTAKPHHIAVEPDGSFWYVSLIADGKVVKLDRDNRVVGEADFETPGMLGLDPGSDLLYVGRSMAAVDPPERLGAIRRSTMEIEEIDVFFPRPHALGVDPHGRRFFTASMGQNSVAYAGVGEEDVDLLAIEGGMHHMLVQFAVSPDGRWMVAGGQMSGALLVFDISGDAPRLARSIAVGGQPWHPTFTPDGSSVWIPNQTANTVTVVETAGWTVADVVRHPALVEPHGSAVSPDGATVYVSSHNSAGAYRPADGSDGRPGTVVAIDARSHEVVAVIETGRYATGMSGPTRVAGH